jgi:hypothetical protein
MLWNSSAGLQSRATKEVSELSTTDGSKLVAPTSGRSEPLTARDARKAFQRLAMVARSAKYRIQEVSVNQNAAPYPPGSIIPTARNIFSALMPTIFEGFEVLDDVWCGKAGLSAWAHGGVKTLRPYFSSTSLKRTIKLIDVWTC